MKKILLLLTLSAVLNTNEGSEMAWVSTNNYLSQSDMENNAALVWEFFGSRGWTIEAVSAMLGNMQKESTINPGIWESLTPYGGGYGLTQWTPYTKYSLWAGNQWEGNGDLECQRIQYEVTLTGADAQWIPTANYPETFLQFTQSTASVSYLTSAFMHNYERPASYATEAERQGYAASWYTYLSGQPAPPVDPTPPDEPTALDQIPVWMYLVWGQKWRQNFTVGKRFV